MAIIEAARVGIPSIATRIYGIVNAIEENFTGLLVPPRDAERLSDAITRLANDKELRESLGFAARKRAIKDFNQIEIIRTCKYWRIQARSATRDND